MVNLRFLNSLILERIKNKGIKNLFSELGFIKWLFKCSKVNKLKNLKLTILRFWPGPGNYLYYCFWQTHAEWWKNIKIKIKNKFHVFHKRIKNEIQLLGYPTLEIITIKIVVQKWIVVLTQVKSGIVNSERRKSKFLTFLLILV